MPSLFFSLYVVPVFIHFLYFFSFKLNIGLNRVLRVQPIFSGHLDIRKSGRVVGMGGFLSYMVLSSWYPASHGAFY